MRRNDRDADAGDRGSVRRWLYDSGWWPWTLRKGREGATVILVDFRTGRRIRSGEESPAAIPPTDAATSLSPVRRAHVSD